MQALHCNPSLIGRVLGVKYVTDLTVLFTYSQIHTKICLYRNRKATEEFKVGQERKQFGRRKTNHTDVWTMIGYMSWIQEVQIDSLKLTVEQSKITIAAE